MLKYNLNPKIRCTPCIISTRGQEIYLIPDEDDKLHYCIYVNGKYKSVELCPKSRNNLIPVKESIKLK